MFSTMRGRAWLSTAMTLTLATSSAMAQRPGAATASPARAVANSATFDALLDGMACKQQKTGRMDCEFRVGHSVRFVIAGVGQEDVVVTFVQADSAGDFIASIVPLHGCVVVKPARPVVVDSVSNFAYVSPKTGKVYHTWATCLSATRTGARAESKADTKADTKTDKSEPLKAAPNKAAAPETRPPPVKPPL